MAKFVMKNGSFWIAKAAKPITATAATKGATTTITGVHDLAIGDMVFIHNSSWKALDGKVFKVTAVSGTASFTIAVDTSAETTTFVTSATIIGIKNADLLEACLSGLDIDSGGVETIAVGTFCDAGAALAGAGTNGTATINGFVDPADLGYQELVKASNDGVPRTFILRLPKAADPSGASSNGGEIYMVNATVGALSQSYQSGAAATFSGSIVFGQPSVFNKAV